MTMRPAGSFRRPAASASPPVSGVQTVLVVHEDEAFRAAAGEALTQAGFGVVAARDSMTAMNILGREARISCLMTTMRMPLGHPHGLALARVARQRWYATVVIILSGDWCASESKGLLLEGAPAIVCPGWDVAAVTREARNALRALPADGW